MSQSQSQSQMPKIPSKRAIAAKVRAYSVAAHERGAHDGNPKSECPACEVERMLDGETRA